MKFLATSFIISTALFIGGCAVNQHPTDSVSVRTAKIDHCTFIGNVSSTGRSPGEMQSNDPAVQENHLNELKQKAHALGANTIVITSSGMHFNKQSSTTRHSMTADAYRCKN